MASMGGEAPPHPCYNESITSLEIITLIVG
jgi:hypothetical protein